MPSTVIGYHLPLDITASPKEGVQLRLTINTVVVICYHYHLLVVTRTKQGKAREEKPRQDMTSYDMA